MGDGFFLNLCSSQSGHVAFKVIDITAKVVDIEAVSVVSRKAAASRKRNHHKTVTRKIITQKHRQRTVI